MLTAAFLQNLLNHDSLTALFPCTDKDVRVYLRKDLITPYGSLIGTTLDFKRGHHLIINLLERYFH